MEYVTLKINEDEKNKLIAFYEDKRIEIKGDYLIFAAQEKDTKILIYSSKNGYKVSYQGKNALSESRIFFKEATLKEKKSNNKIKTAFLDLKSQIGSDEVGTGDLFGPIVVVACYFDEEILKKIDNFKIDDSKKLNDEQIIKTCEKILPYLTYSQYTLMPEKYNQLIEKGYNMNEIKAILHNFALVSLSKKTNYEKVYIDQFCNPYLFYKYLKKANKKAIADINFFPKGESQFPSIALASMIARYSFIKSMNEMNKKYNFEFLKGASNKCDLCLKDFKEKYGESELPNVVKMNFKNVKNC